MNRLYRTTLGIIIMGGFTFFMYLIVESSIFEREHSILVNVAQLNEHHYSEHWQVIVTTLEMDEQAKLQDFHVYYNPQGEVQKLSYEVVWRRPGKQDFIYYYVDYDLITSNAIVKKQKIEGPWLQYDRSIPVKYFFERLDEMDLRIMKPNNDDPIRYMRIHESGSRMTYAIKNRMKYRIDKDQIHEISDAQLPVEGYWLSVCGMSQDAAPDFVSSCEDRIDYVLDARMSDRK
ncbi:hypothetical protein [Paenibacillus sp. Soil750]|uniref:hypothetical protein n=1 Tax=Paenibacillus sp. Soil750 TaxID=1736398 RepID=UPI0006FB05F9|nr:hypothetical protein [Paenibacillus sp. Soil750]KRE65604.1 hypothetical protein ASL11_20135 [Paenibacillus sp. Soil750]